jgi:hypothetical protein
MVERYIEFTGEPGLTLGLAVVRLNDSRYYDPDSQTWCKAHGRRIEVALPCIAPGRYAAPLPALEAGVFYYFQISDAAGETICSLLADRTEDVIFSHIAIREGRPSDPRHVVVIDLRQGRGVELEG